MLVISCQLPVHDYLVLCCTFAGHGKHDFFLFSVRTTSHVPDTRVSELLASVGG